MRTVKLLLVLICASGWVLAPLVAADNKAPGDKKSKLTCCEKAFEGGKECANRCCLAAHRQNKSCLKCNPDKQDLKWKEAEAKRKQQNKGKAAKA